MVIFNSYVSLPEGRLKSTQIWHRSIAVASMSALPLASASLPRSLYPRYGARKVTRETAENPQKVKWYYLLLPLFRILYPTTWYIILWKIPNGGMSKISSHLIPSDTIWYLFYTINVTDVLCVDQPQVTILASTCQHVPAALIVCRLVRGLPILC